MTEIERSQLTQEAQGTLGSARYLVEQGQIPAAIQALKDAIAKLETLDLKGLNDEIV